MRRFSRTLAIVPILLIAFLVPQEASYRPFPGDPYIDAVYSASMSVQAPEDAIGPPDGRSTMLSQWGDFVEYDMGVGESGTGDCILRYTSTYDQSTYIDLYNEWHTLLVRIPVFLHSTHSVYRDHIISYHWADYPYRYIRIHSVVLGIDSITATHYQGQPMTLYAPIVLYTP